MFLVLSCEAGSISSCARYRAATLDTEPRAQIDNKMASFEMASSEVAPYMVILCKFILGNIALYESVSHTDCLI